MIKKLQCPWMVSKTSNLYNAVVIPDRLYSIVPGKTMCIDPSILSETYVFIYKVFMCMYIISVVGKIYINIYNIIFHL